MKFHFDLLAPFYEFFLGNNIHDKVINILQASQNMKILEVGGGTGRVAQNLLEISDQIWMVDPSIPMLREAHLRYPELRLVNSYAEDMPFPSNTFDRIIVYDSLHHWDHHQLALEEIYRVLKPGGMIFIAEIHPRHRNGYFIEKMEDLFRMNSVFHTPQELISIMKSIGFRPKQRGWINQPTYFVTANKI